MHYSALKNLSPAYFTLVMGTGVISISAEMLHLKLLASILFGLNIAFYSILWIMNIGRILRYPAQIFADFVNVQKGSSFLTIVAGSCVLGSQFVIL